MSLIWGAGPKGSTQRFVLIALADNANDDGECWPSVATVSRKTGLCERSVRQALRQLEVDGWLSTEINGGRGGANKYTINPAPDAPEPSLNHQLEPSKKEDMGKPISPADKPPDKMRLPEDWALSDEGWAYARSQAIPDEVIEDEARGFHAYWTDRRDRDAKKSARGWEQCWANRCRSIAGRYKGRGMAGPSFGGGYGQGGSIASIVAGRRARGEI